MNNYFLTMVLKPDLEENVRKELLDDVEKKLKTRAAGKAYGDARQNSKLKTYLWGARELAYPIKRQTKGYYVHFEFEAEPQTVIDLDKSLKVEENILRFLLVRK